ncbi:MAG TPA: hypothetical protein VLE69_00570, partial [Candidatus Saccharimonadales bacterium]|nr:hypothetical protein [Candidatus Saccharimonadales bacterium]
MDPKQTLPPFENDPLPTQPAMPAEQNNQPPIQPIENKPVPTPIPTTTEVPPLTPLVGAVAPKSRKKKFLIIGLVVLFLVLVAGFIFGYYLPNKPDNAYKTGLNRTGYALDKLIKSTTEKSNLESLKKSDITLGIDAKYNNASYTGTFNAKFDTSKANAGINFASTDPDKHNQNFSAKLIGELPSGSQYPNVYVQFNGLKDLDVDSYAPGASNYDGKWIAIMADYLKSLGNVPTADQTSKKQLNSDDIAELAQATVGVTRDYVFTTDPSRAIFEKKSFVGKEKIDGVSTFHYQVTLNKDHVTAFCKAAIDKIYSTNAYKKIPWV